MNSPEESRLDLLVNAERFALIGRYIAYVIVAPLFLFGYLRGEISDLIVLTIVLLSRNAYSHWVLSTGRVHWFRTPFNLFIYLVEVSVIVLFTGAEESTAFILYVLIIIGFGAYCRRFSWTLAVTVLCCLFYVGVLVLEWCMAGLVYGFGEIAPTLVSLTLCGWLMGRVSELIGRTEERYLRQSEVVASSEATLRTILDSAGDPIVVFRESGIITEANEQACALLGVARENLIGQQARRFVLDDGTLSAARDSLRTTGKFSGEKTIIGAQGAKRPLEVVVRSFVRDDDLFFVAVGRDMAAHKKLQEATHHANLQLERLNQDLRSVDAMKTEFLAGMSQRLRSPLSAILGYTEMLLEEELGPITADQRQALQTCKRSATRMFRVMDEAAEIGDGAGL